MVDELGRLLATGERAAFHGRPDAGIESLTRATQVAADSSRLSEALGASWLLGVCLGAAGRYGRAVTVLEPLVSRVDTPEQRVFASLAASTLASIHRQLGRHAVARQHDEEALRAAGEHPEARFDALLGLAADAVGLGEVDAARQRLGEAAQLAATRSDWWRQRVRLGWVEAEVALLVGDTGAATRAARAAVDLAETSGAPRHVAKGLLFLGVAQVEAGSEAVAVTTLRRAALLAEGLGTLPLQWPVRAVLGALLAEADAQESSRCLTAARRAVEAIAADLPQSMSSDWLNRPDITALRGDLAGETG